MPVPNCPNCDYDTRGLPSDICPECGMRLPAVAPPRAPRVRWRVALAVAIIAATFVVGWFTTFVPNYPKWWGPWPVTVVLPLYAKDDLRAAFVPILLIAGLLSIPVLCGRTRIPWATTVLIVGCLALAWLHPVSGVSYGLRFQGTGYVFVCVSIQTIITLTLAAMWWRNRIRPRFMHVFTWHMLASTWLASYAFPYYGELF